MKESETDEILFSNISYLKQFRLNKMGAEVVISDRFLISKFLKGLTHCALIGNAGQPFFFAAFGQSKKTLLIKDGFHEN